MPEDHPIQQLIDILKTPREKCPWDRMQAFRTLKAAGAFKEEPASRHPHVFGGISEQELDHIREEAKQQ